jgi:hypothetical protein
MVINRADSPSFYRGSRGKPVELAINFLGLNNYAGGNEFIEQGILRMIPLLATALLGKKIKPF